MNGGPLESWRRRLPRLARAGRGASGAPGDAADGGRDGAVEGVENTVPEARSPQGKGGAAAGGNGAGPRVAGRTRPRSGAVGASTGSSVAGTRTVRVAAERPPGALGPPRVPYSLQVAAAYAWRVLIVCAAIYVAYLVLLRFELVCIAVFLGLVFTSLLRPPVNALSRYLPRSLSVLVTILGAIALIAGLFYVVGNSVAGESSRLASEFGGGLARIERWLQGPPFHVSHATATGLQGKITSFLESHRSALISQALSGATRAVEILTVLALAVFCSLFFTHSGDRMWRWFQQQLPEGARPTWHRAGSAAWNTFAGYARGVIIVAGANAVMVGISLYFLGVPLALPLTVLEFLASFIPLIGSPIAMAVATVVALAGRGVAIAAVVLILIVVIGQIEGHVLQPLVMGWAVRLHPVVVAVSVIAGSIAAGLLGAVVAVPVVSIGWAVVRELRAPPDAGGGGPDETPEADPDADAIADAG
ncbi:MAG TPA: AI-2E family transporter [Actinocrinis sp.]|uniref:AI-2E family transporter n=1 Tax=Actinocrinis sp. TaxID=1920516 RepID=UPI002DDD4254|nr:AI-2E family transporter [Actinocrinis sp.]HEV3172580.1 AI-2E family transporter [Actinocrinis sp.]